MTDRPIVNVAYIWHVDAQGTVPEFWVANRLDSSSAFETAADAIDFCITRWDDPVIIESQIGGKPPLKMVKINCNLGPGV